MTATFFHSIQKIDPGESLNIPQNKELAVICTTVVKYFFILYTEKRFTSVCVTEAVLVLNDPFQLALSFEMMHKLVLCPEPAVLHT